MPLVQDACGNRSVRIMKPIQSIQEFEQALTENDAVLAYFSTDICSVCKVLKPKIAELIANEFPKMKTESDRPFGFESVKLDAFGQKDFFHPKNFKQSEEAEKVVLKTPQFDVIPSRQKTFQGELSNELKLANVTVPVSTRSIRSSTICRSDCRCRSISRLTAECSPPSARINSS